ncbi:MAG: transglycosylase domain-containing protein [Clostridiales bacterium]
MIKTNKKKRTVLRFILTTIKMIFILILVFSFATAGVVSGSLVGFIKNTSLLSEDDLKLKNFTSIVYDNKGSILTKLDAPINREWISINDIQDEIKYSFIAIEDKRFYEHQGVDFEGFMRALSKKIKNPDSNPEGASTITMQLVRNLTEEKDVTIQRKIKEQWRSIQLEKKLSDKDKILELYLNIIYLGNKSYGVKSAAMKYFNKDLTKTKLTLAESACLAGITQAPTYYNPLTEEGLKNNLEKQKVILQYMLNDGYITKTEYSEALNEKLVFDKGDINNIGSKQSYFVDAVINQVVDDCKELGMQEQFVRNSIYNNGWKIYTTMDSNIQNSMNKVFTNPEFFPFLNQVSASGEKYDIQAGMVIMDQHTGDVKALYGGYGPKTLSNVFNGATEIKRGPGSTFKPIAIYTPGLQTGVIAPCSVVDDLPIYLNPADSSEKYPTNFSKTYHGFTPLRKGVQWSYNVVAANVWRKLDKHKVFNILTSTGYEKEDLLKTDQKVMGTGAALGSVSTNPLQIAGAYTAISNNGVYIEPTLYTKVVKQDGTVLIDKKAGENKQVQKSIYNKGVAYCMTDILKTVVQSGTGSGLQITNTNGQMITTSGKTGTNEEKDRWFVGYTPYYLGSVWFGDKNYQDVPYLNTNPAGKIWHAVMMDAHKNSKPKDYVKPDNVIQKSVCSLSGKSQTSYCSSGTITDLFIKGISKNESCDVHVSGNGGSRIYREFLKYVLPQDMKYVIGPRGYSGNSDTSDKKTNAPNSTDTNNIKTPDPIIDTITPIIVEPTATPDQVIPSKTEIWTPIIDPPEEE